MPQPLVSVLIPMYNAETYIGRCLSSVLGQTYPNIEIIVVDDGSTDSGYTICSTLAQTDSRIRLIQQQNKGSAAARNTALSHANGEYIAWVDADDFVHPNFIDHLYGLITQFNAAVSMCRYEDVDEGSIPAEPKAGIEPDCLMPFEEYCRCLYSIREIEMVALWNKLYHRSLWEGVLFPEGRFIDDDYVVWKLVYKAEEIAVSTVSLYYYFMSQQSIMRGEGSALRRADGLECLEERFAFFEEKGYADLPRLAALTLMDRMQGIILTLGKTPPEKQMKKQLCKKYAYYTRVLSAKPYIGKKEKLKMLMFSIRHP